MSSSNSNKHLTLQERSIIETGIVIAQAKRLLQIHSVKINQLLVKKFYLTGSLPRNVIFHSNVLFIKHASTVGTVRHHVLILLAFI